MKDDIALIVWFIVSTLVVAYAIMTDLPGKSRSQHAEYIFNTAAQKKCGENSVWELLSDGKTVQCFDKRGRKTMKGTP